MTQSIKNEQEVQEKVQTKTIKIYSNVDLTKAINIAKKEKPSVKALKVRTIKKSKSYKEEEITITDSSVLNTQENSIKQYIDECHPNIRKFIDYNPFSSVKANAGQLTIVTKNKLRVVITTIGKFERHVKITDKNKNVLFNEKTSVIIKKEPVKN